MGGGGKGGNKMSSYGGQAASRRPPWPLWKKARVQFMKKSFISPNFTVQVYSAIFIKTTKNFDKASNHILTYQLILQYDHCTTTLK